MARSWAIWGRGARRSSWPPRLTTAAATVRCFCWTTASNGCAPITSISGSCTTCARSMTLTRFSLARGRDLEALLQARAEKRVRFLGITGHHDPAILLEAMRRFDFDTVLVALNAADVHRASFRNTVLVEAARRNMGVIGMKVVAAGRMVVPGMLTMDQAMGYVLSQPGVSNVIVGCWTPEEVDENARIARAFAAMGAEALGKLEQRTAAHHPQFTYYKSPAARG